MGVCGCAGFLRNFGIFGGFLRNFEISVGLSGRFSEAFESFYGDF